MLTYGGYGFTQTYDFQNFTVEDGLSQSQILCLFQIHTGEIWMGTNQGGINKFNGSEFSYITKSEGLSDNVVYAIAQEKSGRILVGTNNGLTVINGATIDTLPTNNALPHKGVVSIHISESSDIWLGTGKGVARLLGDSIVPFTPNLLLSSSTVLNIREGLEGDIWFCTVQNGAFRLKDGLITQVGTDQGLDHNYVYDVMPMGLEKVWIFGHKGLYELSNDSLTDVKMPSTIPKNTVFYGFEKDRVGNVWIGTSTGVIKYFHGRFKQLITTNNGLVNNTIWKILQDREGNIWFGSKSNGISKLTSERFKIYKSEDKLPSPVVNAVFRDDKGRLWSGTKKGLAIWDKDSVLQIRQPDGLSSEVIRDIDQSPDGKMYIGTNYGLTVFDGQTFRSYLAETDNLNSTYDVYVDGTDIWLGTNQGPVKFENGKFHQPFNASEFKSTVFDAVRAGKDIWFAYDDGVLKFDGKSFTQLTKKDGFFDGRTRSIVVGPEGNIWFGTNDGVSRFDGKTCTNYGVADGLLSAAVYSLGFHKDGSLWIGQSKGLSRLLFDNDELEDVIIYEKAQGFLGLECSTNSIWMDSDGKIWIGATNGLVEYDPRKDKGMYYKPLTRITDVKLFSRSVSWTEYTDSVGANGIPYMPILPSDKNDLTIEFSGVSLTSPASINYTCILEGLDDEWRPISHNNFASFPSIPPGDYTFRVRAGFGDELWKNTPVSFSFTIRPPFYQTNWFYLICAFLVCAAIYSYFTIRQANTQITKQKQEIESQRDVIETKNRAMVDSINYASRIQSATLPSDQVWSTLLRNSFVLFKPKDIVSGDFYWLANQGDDVFFAAVDCTGHGVPGALMSIVGYNGLNQAVNEHGLSKPAEILRHLNTSVNESLRKSEHDNYVRDGMDIALCKINLKSLKAEFSGAVNPLFIVRNGEPILIKGDRSGIGSEESEKGLYTNHQIALEKGDRIYIYSDGYADQFGGDKGKKMKTTNMRNKLLETAHLSMNDQRTQLLIYLQEWQGSLAQVDDICVIGVQV